MLVDVVREHCCVVGHSGHGRMALSICDLPRKKLSAQILPGETGSRYSLLLSILYSVTWTLVTVQNVHTIHLPSLQHGYLAAEKNGDIGEVDA